jgi:hypothetical protein
MLDVPSCSILSVFSMLIERLDSNHEVDWSSSTFRAHGAEELGLRSSVGLVHPGDMIEASDWDKSSPPAEGDGERNFIPIL